MIEIPLSPSKHPGAPTAALVDDNCDWLKRFRWHSLKDGKTFYAATWINGMSVKMHRMLFPDAVEVDHESGEGWDNRWDNIRPCTRSQNSGNRKKVPGFTSKFKGVSYRADRAVWLAQVRINGKGKHLGYFATPDEAARAYDVAAVKMFGEFARPNFPV